jgi:hypothetical protein
MAQIIMLSIYGILTGIIILSVFVIRRERKLINKAQKVISDDVEKDSDVLDTFYGKLDEFMTALNEISNKSQSKTEK